MTTRTGRRVRPRAYRAEPLEGRQLLATISGVVFNDADADGLKDVLGEPGVSGWTVYVDGNENGAFDAGEPSAASAAGGAWSISGAAFRTRETYHVRIVAQATWRLTRPAAREYAVTFGTLSDTVSGLDFGQTRRAMVTGKVFNDVNDDGTWDREPVLSGRTVFADANDDGLLDAGEASAVTDASGDYALAPAAGTYTVRQVRQAGWWQTFPSPPGAGHLVTLATAQTVSNRHFGNVVATVDLLGVGFAITSAFDPVPADGRLDVTYQVRNDGTADSAPYRVAFYLSEDATITPSDTLLRSVAQGAAPRHTVVERTTPLTLPRPDPFRSTNRYYVGMIVDADGDVAETSETNNSNRGVLADRFPVSSEADLPSPVDNANVLARPLVVGGQASGAIGDEWIGGNDQDVYRLPVTRGHSLHLAVTGLATPAMIRLYDSTWSMLEIKTGQLDKQVFASDTYYVVVSSGGNGLNDPRRLSGRVEGPTGPYTLTASAGSNGDLRPTEFDVTGEPGGPLRATFKVSGVRLSFPAPEFNVSLFLSDDRSVSPGDVLLATARVSGYDNDADEYSGAATFDLPAVDPFHTDNQYWIGLIVDSADEVAESDEGNNAGGYASRRSEQSLPSPADGDEPQSLHPVAPGSPGRGAIGDEWIGPYDQDLFILSARAGERWRLDLDAGGGTGFDSYLRLYDLSWNLLASNDNGAAPDEAAGADSFIDYTFAAETLAWVVVSGSGNHYNHPLSLNGRLASSTGAYELTAATDPAGPVTGVVFDDANANGTRDPGEGGLAGWTVYLDSSNDGRLGPFGEPTTTTDGSGAFTFSGLRAGTYALRRVVPAGWIATSPELRGYTVTVASGQSAGPYAFGNIREAAVSGSVYDDADHDGNRDGGEGGVAGWAVYADLNHNGVRDVTTLMLADPEYHPAAPFLDLVVPPSVRGDVADVNVYVSLAGLRLRAALVGPDGTSAELFSMSSPTPRPFVGILDDEADPAAMAFPDDGPPAESLAVFDGTPAAGPWRILFKDFAGFVLRPTQVESWSLAFTLSEPFALTDAEGRYEFHGLTPGQYEVRVDPGPEWIATAPSGGAHPVTLAAGDIAPGRDFGAYRRSLRVVARHVFYNNSVFDGRNAAMNEADDGAIAPDRSPLPAGAAPSSATVTGYSRGINGVMVDVAEMLAPPTLADFSFKAPSSFNPSVWLDAPAPTGFAVRDLPGGDHLRRVTFTWPDNLIRNTWLQVGVLANAATRRSAPDLSYIGNLVGESGAGRVTRVDGADLLATRAALHKGAAGPVSPFDFNGDGVVNVRDEAVVRSAIGNALPTLVAPTAAGSLRVTSGPRNVPAPRQGWTAAILSDE
jgi:hypothetical protein